jgi:hypothetical protein
MVKWPGQVADLSPLSNVKVMNIWNYTSTPSYVFMAQCSSTETFFSLLSLREKVDL